MTRNLDDQKKPDLYQAGFENYNEKVQRYGQTEACERKFKPAKEHLKKHLKNSQHEREDPSLNALYRFALLLIVLLLMLFVFGPLRYQLKLNDYLTLKLFAIYKREKKYESVDLLDPQQQEKRILTYVSTTGGNNINFYLDFMVLNVILKLYCESRIQNVETDAELVHLLRKEFHMSFLPFQYTLSKPEEYIGRIINLQEEYTTKARYMKLTDIEMLMHYGHLASVLLSAAVIGTSSYDGNISHEIENNINVNEALACLSISSSLTIVPDYDPKCAIHVRYKDFQSRIKSFQARPDTHAPSPHDMAAAGFFYAGRAECVRCHYCDLAVEHWGLNQQPLQEHVRRKPFCGYVQFACRQDFIKKVLDAVDKKETEKLYSIPESAKETSSGKGTGIPRSDTSRERQLHPEKSSSRANRPNRFARLLFGQCGHVAEVLECVPASCRCPMCPTTTSSKALATANVRVSERKAVEKDEPIDEELADEEGSSMPGASERVSGESSRSSSDQLQSDVDLRTTRPQSDVMEISALLGESFYTETKTGDTESKGNQERSGQDVRSLVDLAKMCALYSPLNTDISICETEKGKAEGAFFAKPPADSHQDTFVDLHLGKLLPILGDDGRSESNPLVTELAPHIPTAKDEASQRLHENDDANEVVEDQSSGTTSPSQQAVEDVLRAVQEATRGIKHPVIRQMLDGWRPLFQDITAHPVVPQSREEGLTSVDFRSPPRERMNIEGFRAGTFLLYPRADEHAVLRLANAGFYYTGRDDTLACFCCDVTFTYADRRPDEDPYDIHRQLNPNCPHLAGGDTRNVFIQDEQTRATSGRDITSEGNEPDEPNIPISQLVAEAIARLRSAVSTLYTVPAVPNAASRNQIHLLSTDPENIAQNHNSNNNTTHGTNRSFEEPRPGQIGPNALIVTISNAYENSTPASPEGRPMGGGNNGRPRQDSPSFPQSGNVSGQRIPAFGHHQTPQTLANGSILNPSSTNIQERSRRFNEIPRSPVPPQPSAQVHDNLQHSAPNPPVSASSTSTVARESEASPPSASPAATESDYDPSRAVHPQYTDLQRRQDSFRQWPDTHAQSPEELAVAGFFFTGVGDCVRCHYCGLGLKHWDPDDRPLDEHVRWRSSCGYLRALYPQDVIFRTLARLGGGRHNAQAAAASSGQDFVVAQALAPPPTPGSADHGSQQTATPQGDVADLMTSDAAEAARAMGFSNDVIERAIRALLGTRAGRRAVTTQNLANAIIYLQGRGRDVESSEASDNDTSDNDHDDSDDDNGGRETRGSNPGDSTPPRGSHSPTHSGDAGAPPRGVEVRASSGSPQGSGLQAAAPQPRNGHRVPDQLSRETLRRLEEENRDLRERRRCKICLDSDVSILFLPCGHLVCCAECAPALRRCPMCRRRISGTVRIQLASVPPASATD